MRYLAIDIGDKRTGLAIGDDQTRMVLPLHVLEVPTAERGGETWLEALNRAIADQVSPHAAAELVVGLPLNMDGTEGPRAAIVRALAARLAERTRRAVRFQDERLTSADADWAMARTGLTRGEKKKQRDALAAAAILRDFLARPTAPAAPATHADTASDGPPGGTTGSQPE